MSGPEDLPGPYAASDLVRSLAAIGRTQNRWLQDLESVCAGDPSFLPAFRRWEEWLTLLKLHIHRAEERLLHYLLIPEDMRPWRDLPGEHPHRHNTYRYWYGLVEPYFRSLHIETAYRRLGQVLDPREEAITADIVTDIVSLAEVAQSTNQALEQIDQRAGEDGLENLAFYHVISPWKQHGMLALFDLLRWLNATLLEQEEI